MNKFKVSEVIEAMEKNGFPFATGTVYDRKRGASCIFGQAVRNLFPEVTTEEAIIATGWALISAINEFDSAGSDIWKYNDSYRDDEDDAYAEIIAFAKERLAGFEDKEVTMYPEFEEI